MTIRRITFNEMQKESGIARGILRMTVYDDLLMTKMYLLRVLHTLTPQQDAMAVYSTTPSMQMGRVHVAAARQQQQLQHDTPSGTRF